VSTDYDEMNKMFFALSGRAGCPECGGGDGSCRVHADDWGYCKSDRCRWLIGSGSAMFSTADKFIENESEGRAFLSFFADASVVTAELAES
jgi:hypothetical protein